MVLDMHSAHSRQTNQTGTVARIANDSKGVLSMQIQWTITVNKMNGLRRAQCTLALD
jgi:hypothetical protein